MRRFVGRRVVFIALVGGLLLVGRLRHVSGQQDAQPVAEKDADADLPTPRAAVRPATVPPVTVPPSEASLRAWADEFDQSIFGEKGQRAASGARSRLSQILAGKVDAIDRVCGLSAVAREKLRLAGGMDILRLEDRLDRQRQAYIEIRSKGRLVDLDRGELPEIGALRQQLRNGPFDDESLFDKTQRRILSAEQVQKFARRQERAARSTAKITVENARALVCAGRIRRDVHDIVWSRDDDRLALVTFNKPVEICSGLDFKRVRTIGAGRRVVGFDFSPDPDVVAIAENSKKAFLLNLATGKELELATSNPQPDVAFSRDGKFLVTGGYGSQALLWSATSGKRLRKFNTGAPSGLRPIFSPNGRIVAIGNRNEATELFDAVTGQFLRVLPRAMSQDLKFDPSGKRLAVAYVGGSLGLWDVASGELIKSADARAEELYSVDWSPDGKIIATSGRNASVCLWNAADLALLHEIEAPEWVIFVRFNPEGTRLIFAGGAALPGGERSIRIFAVPE
jgi:hypothetical protein